MHTHTTNTWVPRYLGLKYLEDGRDVNGVDCWGLIRLIYMNEAGIELPDFRSAGQDPAKAFYQAYLVEKENWERVLVPQPMDLVVFKMGVMPDHVGMVTSPGKFIHVREGKSVLVEKMHGAFWANKIQGFYRYKPNNVEMEEGSITPREELELKKVAIKGMPSVLKTIRLDSLFPEGTSLKDMDHFIRANSDMDEAIWKHCKTVFIIKGRVIPVEEWTTTRPTPEENVNYRVVPRKSGSLLGTIFKLAIAVTATLAAPYIGALGAAALLYGASALQNAIFPTRQQKPVTLEPSKRLNILTGGSNQSIPFSPIPVLFGQRRITPPWAAKPRSLGLSAYTYFQGELLWGFAPIQVDNITIGDSNISDFVDVEHVTVGDNENEAVDMVAYNNLVGDTAHQDLPNLDLRCYWNDLTAINTVSGTVTAQTATPHGLTVGMMVAIDLGSSTYSTFYTILTVPDTTHFTFASASVFTATSCIATQWTTRTMSGQFSRMVFCHSFTEGLAGLDAVNGGLFAVPFGARIEVKKVNEADPEIDESDWFSPKVSISSKVVTLPTNAYYFNPAGSKALGTWPTFRTMRVTVDSGGKIHTYTGGHSWTAYNGEPSGDSDLYARQVAAAKTTNAPLTRLRDIPDTEQEIFQITTFGLGYKAGQTTGMYHKDYPLVVDKRADLPGGYTGMSISYNNALRTEITIAAGTISTAGAANEIEIGASGQPHCMMNDGFVHNYEIIVPYGRYKYRIARMTRDYQEESLSAYKAKCTLLSVTGFEKTKPVTFPKALTRTAFKIRSSTSVNGQLDGFRGTATAILKDWTGPTGETDQNTWVARPTRSVAAAFRGALQHPCRRDPVPDAEINLTKLAEWSEKSDARGFTYDNYITDDISMLDLLWDIAAAGMASPVFEDGKWSVIIDEPRDEPVQLFTPMNTWGFKGVRNLNNKIHGVRITYENAAAGFQPDELYIYVEGYNSTNATKIVGLTLPGVTEYQAAYYLGRRHLAQINARPETYTFYTDIEHIACMRGDWVLNNHDIPLWGSGFAYIQERVSGTVLKLNNPLYMEASTNYAMKIRLADGSFIDRIVDTVPTAGYYSQITLTVSVNTTQGAAYNHCAFGILDATVDTIVLEIEPQDDYTAMITCVDYAPGIFTVDEEDIPEPVSNVTLPPQMSQQNITQKPIIDTTKVISSEKVMKPVGPGVYNYGMRVPFSNPLNFDNDIAYVEIQVVDYNDSTKNWLPSKKDEVTKSQIEFFGVAEGAHYRYRLRYISSQGRPGPWTDEYDHTITGRLLPPPDVSTPTFRIKGGAVVLDWAAVSVVDLWGYEVRVSPSTSDVGWNSATFVKKIQNPTELLIDTPQVGNNRWYYVKALDTANHYSTNAAKVQWAPSAPGTVPLPTQEVEKINGGTVTLGLTWDPPTVGTFNIAGYEIRTANSGWGTTGYKWRGSTNYASLLGVNGDVSVTTQFYIKAYDVDTDATKATPNYSATARNFSYNAQRPSNMNVVGPVLTITRSKAVLTMKITGYSSAAPKPSDFLCWEFRIGKYMSGATSGSDGLVVDGTTDNFWDDPDCFSVNPIGDECTIDLNKFALPRLAASPGMKYRVAVRQKDKSGNFSLASKVGHILVSSLS